MSAFANRVARVLEKLSLHRNVLLHHSRFNSTAPSPALTELDVHSPKCAEVSSAKKSDAPAQPRRLRTNEEVRAARNALFSAEKSRQIEDVRRIEKIEVQVRGPPEDCTLVMNKNLSTPTQCAQHITEMLVNRTALAMVDGKPWDMHRPLEANCEMEFQHFLMEYPAEANLAFWRTGSLLLSYVAEKAFRDNLYVEVHSWPHLDIHSGSFICDIDLKLPEWTPKEDELRAMTLMITRLIQRKVPLERLEISADLALKMFEHNRFKRSQIPKIAEKSPTQDRVIVYRLEDHVEISSGPMLANTSLIGRHHIAAVYPIECHGIGRLFRFQGIALPAQQPLNYFAWKILLERARRFNDSPVPEGLLQIE